MTRPDFFANVGKRTSKLPLPLCLGLDPTYSRDGCDFLRNEELRLGPEDFLVTLGESVITAALPFVGAVKFQSAFFEAFGAPGLSALATLIAFCRSESLPTILDAKRGDISSSMRGYGEAAFDRLQADCLTVTPYLGEDVIEPLIPWLQSGKAVYVVWTTSNPGGDLFQRARLEGAGPETTLRSLVFERLTAFARRKEIVGSLGFVAGATKIEDIEKELWEDCRRWPLLLPGLGPQGAQFGHRLLELVREKKAAHLLPMSRGLTGLGDPAQGGALAQLSEWSGLARLVESNCRQALSQAAQLPLRL